MKTYVAVAVQGNATSRHFRPYIGTNREAIAAALQEEIRRDTRFGGGVKVCVGELTHEARPVVAPVEFVPLETVHES